MRGVRISGLRTDDEREGGDTGALRHGLAHAQGQVTEGARQTSDRESRRRIATVEGSHASVVVTDTGRDSRRFARPSEPVTDTAVSKES